MATAEKRLPPLFMEDLGPRDIVLRNFSGRPDRYKPAGTRSFKVLLNDLLAEALLADGWNVKYFKLKPDAEEGATPQAFLDVAVRYDGARPPIVYILTQGGKKRTALGEDEIELLDIAEIESFDLLINPFHWELNGESGVKAYLKKLQVTLFEDEIDLKYNSTITGEWEPEED